MPKKLLSSQCFTNEHWTNPHRMICRILSHKKAQNQSHLFVRVAKNQRRNIFIEANSIDNRSADWRISVAWICRCINNSQPANIERINGSTSGGFPTISLIQTEYVSKRPSPISDVMKKKLKRNGNIMKSQKEIQSNPFMLRTVTFSNGFLLL